MVFFNYALRKLNAKIVYYGPGLCGKTTNLVWIHDHFEGGERGKMISLATEGDRTIFFDLLPIEIGSIRGMNVTLQLYTVPGQVHYNSTRQLVLRGADGVVFVGDSQRTMQSSNIDSFKNLQENLLLQGISIDGFPHVLQFNKRDLTDIVPVEELDDDLNVYRAPIFEAVATDGIGVQESLEGIVKLVMRSLRERYEGAAASGRPPGIEDSAISRPPVGMPETPPEPAGSPISEPGPFTAPPMGEAISPELGAETVELSQSYGADSSDGEGAGGLEDEISTGVYDLSGEDAGVLANLGLPSRPDVPPPASEPPVAPTADFDIESITGAALPPPVLDVGGESFTGFPSDPETMMPEIDDLTTSDETEISDVDFDIPVDDLDVSLDDVAPEFEAPSLTAELETGFEVGSPPAEPDIPEVTVPPVAAEPDIPEFVTPSEVAEPDVPEFEAPSEIAEPDIPEFAVAESPPTRAEIPGLEVTPPAAEPEFPEIEFISQPEEGDAAPPIADLLPPSERYEDRIEAPSPFAPHPQGPAGDEDAPEALDAAAFQEAEAVAEVEPDEIVAEFEPEGIPPEAEPEEIVPEVEAEEIPPGVEPEEIAPEVEPAIAEAESYILRQAALEPIMVGDGEPWTEEEISGIIDTVGTEKIEGGAIEPAPRREVAVSAEDNQLHLRLHGTGAIIESGQVRELDIEVPVPGAWVGNRRVTLQLRLTLTPDTEDENGGSGSPS